MDLPNKGQTASSFVNSCSSNRTSRSCSNKPFISNLRITFSSRCRTACHSCFSNVYGVISLSSCNWIDIDNVPSFVRGRDGLLNMATIKPLLWTERFRLIAVGIGEKIRPVNYDTTVMIYVSCLRWVSVCLADSSGGNGPTTKYKWQCSSHCGDTCGRICFWIFKVWLNMIIFILIQMYLSRSWWGCYQLFSPLEEDNWSQTKRPLGGFLSS